MDSLNVFQRALRFMSGLFGGDRGGYVPVSDEQSIIGTAAGAPQNDDDIVQSAPLKEIAEPPW
ncbi:hypothetical protein [Rhodoligotrophos defluvii]|uniref:hypothetical protein n=1 Tax=Rhodoligotrophos defluvii TaxID=2561934 RepID=UPI0010C95E95|nr:hypothetical protein [Rhodoligotrophos defluvii]